MESLIVFSHLRWDFVYQRPQHLMSRLARHYRIVFFEEPQPGEGGSSAVQWETSQPLPQLTVVRPLMPIAKPGFHQVDPAPLRRKLRELRQQHPDHRVWFYTPMAMPLLDELDPVGVVYDCMDELSAFMNPPPRLLEHEHALLQRADLVFTGGPSLYEAKRGLHPEVHCFPSSVDIGHFRQALDRNIAYAPHRRLPGPRLGYFGVLDERFDIALVAALADAHPDWQIVLVGPVAKIEPDSLPRRDNIHYMGQQPYSALPSFLASWDLCLMPFAMNASTRFISPTKSLEYMAAELPVVSTPVPDVVGQHADVVTIAGTTDEFIAGCERALAMPAAERQARIRQMRFKLARTSWDTTAQQMHALLRRLGQAQAATSAGAESGAS